MNTKNFLFAFLFSLCLLSSCVSQQTAKPEEPEKPTPTLTEQYIMKGELYEDQGQLQSALAQYELALTMDANNLSALDHKKKVEATLYEIARQHYEKGFAFDEQGRYGLARKQYLSALQNWPDYTEAKEKLSPGGVSLNSEDYILHTLLEGQSVSKLSQIYYGNMKYYPIIGKFNTLDDVTWVRSGDKLKIPALNGLTVKDLKKKYDTYMKDRQDAPLFKKGQAADPDNSQIAANLFENYFQQGLTQFNKEQYLEAKQSFSSAVQYNGACNQCLTYIKTCEEAYKEKHYNLGIHFFGKEQLAQAINEWERVENIDPNYKDVQSSLKKARTLYERLESIRQSNTK